MDKYILWLKGSDIVLDLASSISDTWTNYIMDATIDATAADIANDVIIVQVSEVIYWYASVNPGVQFMMWQHV